MKTTINRIIEILEDHNFEIVSYGLAPNPNGFCFQYMGDDEDEKKEFCAILSMYLDGLNRTEIEYLKRNYL